MKRATATVRSKLPLNLANSRVKLKALSVNVDHSTPNVDHSTLNADHSTLNHFHLTVND
ncbi:MAG: hypothetical protein IAF58_00240 [Leptolyngbya sp.]|nr:hypothetical protein [Candidatus Melainabacteria bacterium]